jgi:glucosamine--fructose-6-phosphate aminotransferase (isomerizing)
MCGIIAVVRRPSGRTPPAAADVLRRMERAWAAAGQGRQVEASTAAQLGRAAAELEAVDDLLRGTAGLGYLLGDPAGRAELDRRAGELEHLVRAVEASLDAGEHGQPTATLEAVNAALVRLKDALWAIRRDRIRTAQAVEALARPGASPQAEAEADQAPSRATVEAYASIQTALSALDRLEVRGRDSAGLHVLVTGHGLDPDDPEVAALLAARRQDRLFTSRAVRTPCGHLSFVYKAASEVGELGDNGRRLRAAIAGDALLRRALAGDGAEAMVLGHTRWASVGMINEANAHPLNQEEDGRPDTPYTVAALNGDVDNHARLVERHGLHLPDEITTDAKVIPVLVSRRLAAGLPLEEAFRQTVAEFDGSVAIAASVAEAPGRVLLALRGSGQALYVGLADDLFVVASEPYGLVEESARYLRMDGEAGNDQDGGGRGQIVVLDRALAGTTAGIRRRSYQGTDLPVGEADLQRAEITTRDIDRGAFRHYLLKEISEAPLSLRKTLRGRIREAGGRLAVHLGPETLPDAVRHRLHSGAIRRVLVIGQGTAAVAGMSVAASISEAVRGSALTVTALPATELSGFGLDDDMGDALVVAISQSGTTTDTNRTVDLLRARGAAVLAIVNRRGSDLTHKADGVLFTSDGRDVEMSVASTKAFYGQVAAGLLLAFAVADAIGADDPDRRHELLAALRELPTAMERLLGQREHIASLAQRHAPAKRYWAVVGNGPNRVAAEEIRIKLSELCYKSIACDATENKKHIDLSSEPLTLICAAGLTGSAADDVAKEVAIFRAHKSVPLVIATEGEARFTAAAGVIAVPAVHPTLAYVLSTMAGHLFGYEAALAIDAQALPLRQARAAIERTAGTTRSADELLDRLGPELEAPAAEYRTRLRGGRYDGSLEASTALSVASLLRYAGRAVPLDAWQAEFGTQATPGAVVDDLAVALTAGIDELTRPIDAIKHQAKTVTVGISRSDETVLTVPLVRQLLDAGAVRAQLGYDTLRTVAALDPAVARVLGFTRYRIEGEAGDEAAKLTVLAKGGIAERLVSRAEQDHRLRGTKQLVAIERQVLAARGRSDGRTVVLVPEVADGHVAGLTLLHVDFHERLPAARVRTVLEGYRGRLAALRSAVTETEPAFDETLLAELPVASLVTDPVEALADRWRSAPAAP